MFRFKNKTPQKTYEHVDVGTLIVLYTALTCTGVFFYPFYHKNATWTEILRLKIYTRRNSESEIHLKYNWWSAEFTNIPLKVVKKPPTPLLILLALYKADKC